MKNKYIKAYAPKKNIPSGCDCCYDTLPTAYLAEIFNPNTRTRGIPHVLICENCLRQALNLIDKKRAQIELKKNLNKYNKLYVDPISKKQLAKVVAYEAFGWTHCQWDGADDPRQHAWFAPHYRAGAERMPVAFEKLPPLHY